MGGEKTKPAKAYGHTTATIPTELSVVEEEGQALESADALAIAVDCTWLRYSRVLQTLTLNLPH